jgi:hypothetical protein
VKDFLQTSVQPPQRIDALEIGAKRTNFSGLVVGVVDPSTWVTQEEYPKAPQFCELHTLAGPDNLAHGRRLLGTLETLPRYSSHKPTDPEREEPKDVYEMNETEDDFGSKATAPEGFSWAFAS